MKKGQDRALPLRVSEKKVFVGFFHAVKVELRDEKTGKSPTPQTVYKVLRDERPSAKLLRRIFERCPDLLSHPATSEAVQRLYLDFITNGHRLPERYAKGGTVLAKECA